MRCVCEVTLKFNQLHPCPHPGWARGNRGMAETAVMIACIITGSRFGPRWVSRWRVMKTAVQVYEPLAASDVDSPLHVVLLSQCACITLLTLLLTVACLCSARQDFQCSLGF